MFDQIGRRPVIAHPIENDVDAFATRQLCGGNESASAATMTI